MGRELNVRKATRVGILKGLPQVACNTPILNAPRVFTNCAPYASASYIEALGIAEVRIGARRLWYRVRPCKYESRLCGNPRVNTSDLSLYWSSFSLVCRPFIDPRTSWLV